MAAQAAALARAQVAAGADGHDQGPLLATSRRSRGATPRRADPRRRRDRRSGRYNCSTEPSAGRRPVRLLGVSVHNLCADGDLP